MTRNRLQRTHPADPLVSRCPFCEDETGPQLAVYNHIDDDHDNIDPNDLFSDPIGPLRQR